MEHVFKSYRKAISLKDVSLFLGTGKPYGLVGHNGNGKWFKSVMEQIGGGYDE